MVVDVQCHWYPRAFFETLTERSDYPRCERVEDGYRTELGPSMSFPVTAEHFDLEQQLAESKAVGIDVLVSSTGSTPIDSLPVPEARELATLLNEARSDMQREHPERFVGLATLPMSDVDAALATLEDAAGRLALRGVCLCSNVAGESIASEEVRPLYARINELGLPVFLHPTRSVMADKLARFGLDFSVGFMFDTTVAALELIFTGLIDELADVPVVHPHLGATIPFLAGRIDYQSSFMPVAKLDRPPSEYLRRFHTDTVCSAPSAVLQAAVDFYGVDKIMFATDFPFWQWADGLPVVMDNFEAAEREAVLGGNARRVLGLG